VPIETKLQAPRPARRLITRRRLVKKLTGEKASLVVFSAPAGYGKTLAVSQWLQPDGRPWAWIQLDDGDNDPVTLLQYLSRALLGLSPLNPAVLAWLELPVPPVRKAILPALVKAVSLAPPFVLVLDDTHLVQEPRCWQALSVLLAGLSRGSSLVLCGRSDPPLPVERLRLLDEAAEYGVADLAFDDDETAELLRLHDIDADDGQVAGLAQASEGWPAGVYLTMLSWRTGEPGLRPLPRQGRRQLGDYLNAEVLDAVPADILQFLTRTSIVTSLSPGLCNQLTGRKDSGRLLSAIERENLFLVPLDDVGEQYRYHHLFGDLLQTELKRREPQALPRLHRCAARWFEREDRVREALLHLFAAGEIGRAADLVAARWWSRYLTGRVLTARRWVDMFSSDQLGDHPALTLAAAWVYALTERSDLARSLLSAFDPPRLDETPAVERAESSRATFALLKALLAADGPSQMREDARAAVALEEAHPGPWRAFCELTLGVAEMLCGSDDAARRPLELAASQAEVWHNGVDLSALGDLSLLAGDAGRWGEAEDHALEAIRRVDAYSIGDYLSTASLRLARDRLAARGGDDDALADLEDLLKQSDWDFCPWIGVRAALLLAEALLARDDPRAARQRLDQAQAMLARWAPAPGLARRVSAIERSLQLCSLVEPLSNAELRVLTFLPTNLTASEIAAQLGVSPNTVGSHVKALHRKLGAGRRSEVVERAATMGLLPSQPPHHP
jgi:LuxR family transcriptional regulator, maltose regulon positive regulatory protein